MTAPLELPLDVEERLVLIAKAQVVQIQLLTSIAAMIVTLLPDPEPARAMLLAKIDEALREMRQS